jgi:HEAT repeat protein
MYRRERSSRAVAVALFVLFALFVPSLARVGAEEKPAPSEDELIAVLDSGAPVFEKAKACQRLSVVGTAKAVPALVKLLGSAELAHYARFGLEPIPHPSVDTALRDAMTKLEGRLLIGVINSIGARRDAGALNRLTGLLQGRDVDVAAAAVVAVGRIATPEAAGVLKEALKSENEKFRRAAGDASLQCAEKLLAKGERGEAVSLHDTVRRAKLPKHTRMAGLRGAILARGAEGAPILVRKLLGKNVTSFSLALLVSRELPGSDATSAIVGALGKLPADRKALVIRALGDRRDPVALPAVLEAVGGPEVVRMAAVVALRQLGDASAVPVLLGVAATDEGGAAEAALVTLSKLAGDGVDRAIVAALDAGDAGKRAVLIDIVGRRRIRSATPALRRSVEGSDPRVRRAAIAALGKTAGLGDLSFLIQRFVAAASDEDAEACLAALHTACATVPDADACAAVLVEATRETDAEETCQLVGVFNAVGGAKALAAVAARAGAGDATVRECAKKTLGEWRTPDAVPVLLDLARKAPNAAERASALRAASHIIRRLGFPKAERLARCGEAMEIAKSAAERKVVLHAYAGIPAPETLAILERHFSDPELREAACVASVTIAERLVRSRRSDAARAMKAVLETTKDEQLAKKARKLYRTAGGKR